MFFCSLRGKGTSCFFFSVPIDSNTVFLMAGFLGPTVSGKLQTLRSYSPAEKKQHLHLHGLKKTWKSAVPKWQEMLRWRTQKVQAMLQTCPSCNVLVFCRGLNWVDRFFVGHIFYQDTGFLFWLLGSSEYLPKQSHFTWISPAILDDITELFWFLQ